MRPLTGEQNRLIQANIDLPAKIAAHYRGRKSIPFEDLVSEGMVALVVCARNWSRAGTFAAYAEKTIKSELLQFINNWQEFEPFEPSWGAGEKLIYEWQNAFFALYEHWDSDPYSPEDLIIKFESIGLTAESLDAAFIGLSKRERQMIEAYCIAYPQRNLEQIARDHRVSYKRATKVIDRALNKMGEAVKNKRQPSNVIAFPARAPRRNSDGSPNNKQRA